MRRAFLRQEWRTLGAGSAVNLTAAVITERSADMFGKTTSTTPSYFTVRFDRRLESWHDPTPRKSEPTFEEFREACLKAARRSRSLMAARKASLRPSEEQVRQIEEQDRKFSMIALEVYAKQNNMQPTELELVEVKQRSLIDESGLGYLHYNFIVKGLDGKHTMFFAEVHHDLEDENVYLCKPLAEDDLKPSTKNDQLSVKGVNMGLKSLYIPVVVAFLVVTRMFARGSWTTMTTSVITSSFRPCLRWV